MAVKIRRTYKGAAVSAVLDSGGVSSATQTSISLTTSPSTWPTGKFFVVVAPGTAQEEKMCVTLSGSTLTVVDPAVTSTSASTNGRGVDNTTARSTIAGGSTVYPVYTAVDADEANELTSTYSAQGHIVYQGASTFAGLAIGTAAQVLKVNSGATAPEWGQVATAGIADGAVTADKLGTGAVTSAKILDGTIVLGDLAAALQAFLVPVGTITAYAGATAPTGWLMCDGTSTTGYTTLAGLVGATTPDLRGRFPMGKTASSTGSTLLGTGGSNTITSSNMPAHTHSIDHNHASANTVEMDDTFLSHSITDPGHFHDTFSSLYLFDYQSGNDDSANSFQTANNDQNTSTNTTGISIGNHNIKHSHSLDLPNFTGTSGETGSGTAYFQPFVAVNYIIKHD